MNISLLSRAVAFRSNRSAGAIRGFSLVELSVVLVVLAIIVGAVATATDLIRQASGQRIFTDFVSSWKSSYVAFVTQNKYVPGDNPLTPTGRINGVRNGVELCNDGPSPDLTNEMLARSIDIPVGRGPGREDEYLYQDGDGVPHLLRACFVTVPWSVPGRRANEFVVAQRHVIHFSGMTPELALQMDALIDGNSDSRFGKFRSLANSGSISPDGSDWPRVRDGSGRLNVVEVDAYLLLN